MDRLDQPLIQINIIAKDAPVEVLQTVASTNDYMKQKHNTNQVAVCLAEQQTNGRGRFRRYWYSPFGQNIYLSCYYPIYRQEAHHYHGLTLVIGLAIARTLKQYLRNDAGKLMLKWPNDVVYDDNKLAGCLVELDTTNQQQQGLVIGIGINVNMNQIEPERPLRSWTSLQQILQKSIDRNDLAIHLINTLLSYLRQFMSTGFSVFQWQWLSYDALYNRLVYLQTPRQTFRGYGSGVDHQGHLCLKMSDHTIQTFSSGEVSLFRSDTY